MSYQVLARKWRPAQFNQVVGQTHVLEPLRHALENDRLHHAYLFTGTRGVGKTTIARILAKALNCQQGVTSTPCGECESCLQIDQGRFVDLLEIDAASRTKVEDTRELLDNVQYRPTQGRFKVYLIDEVHMLSRHSFNALLKTLEEPPEHVKFLLATTDPQKLPITVVSRCLQFNLRALTSDLISGQLEHVLSAETVPYDSQALPLLARAARGSMRDALSLTDQAIAQGRGQVQLESVQQMLGNLPVADVQKLLQHIVANDANGAFEQLEKMTALLPDISVVLTELQALLHRLALVQQLPELANHEEQSAGFNTLVQQVPAEVVQLYYQIVLEGRKELPYSVDDRSGVEMTLLRLLAFRPTEGLNVEPSADFAAEPTSLPESVTTPAPAMGPAADPEPKLEPGPQPQPEPEPEPAPQASASSGLDDLLKTRDQLLQQSTDTSTSPAPAGEKKNTNEPSAEQNSPNAELTPVVALGKRQEPNTMPEAGAELTPDIRRAEQLDEWAALIVATEVTGLARQLLLNSNLEKIADNHWRVVVAPDQQSLLSAATEQTVRDALTEVLSSNGNFEFTVEEPRVPTPLMIQQRIDAYQHQLAVEWIHQNQAVAELKQRFAAEIDDASITAVY